MGEITDLRVEFDGTRVTFTYRDVLRRRVTGAVRTDDGPVSLDEDEGVRDGSVEVTFDLKNIEAIEAATDSYIDDISYDEADRGDIFPLYLVFKAANGQQIANSGEGYKAKADCLHGIDLIKDGAAKAKTDDKS